jgi:hypothetical protein
LLQSTLIVLLLQKRACKEEKIKIINIVNPDIICSKIIFFLFPILNRRYNEISIVGKKKIQNKKNEKMKKILYNIF